MKRRIAGGDVHPHLGRHRSKEGGPCRCRHESIRRVSIRRRIEFCVDWGICRSSIATLPILFLYRAEPPTPPCGRRVEDDEENGTEKVSNATGFVGGGCYHVAGLQQPRDRDYTDRIGAGDPLLDTFTNPKENPYQRATGRGWAFPSFVSHPFRLAPSYPPPASAPGEGPPPW